MFDMIKKLLFLPVFMMMIFIAGCNKTVTRAGCTATESTVVAPANEIAFIQAYLTANGLTAVQAPSGFFYSISPQGTGAKPTLCSNVTVKYAGYLFNGFKFDESLTGASFTLSNLIIGWQQGMELLNNGGSMILYIPPSLGYGSLPNGIIPANSYLRFTLQLINVQ